MEVSEGFLFGLCTLTWWGASAIWMWMKGRQTGVRDGAEETISLLVAEGLLKMDEDGNISKAE